MGANIAALSAAGSFPRAASADLQMAAEPEPEAASTPPRVSTPPPCEDAPALGAAVLPSNCVVPPPIPGERLAALQECRECVVAFEAPETSRKERITRLAAVARIAEGAPIETVRELTTQTPLWECLLAHCLNREKLVRVYAMRALRYLILDEGLAAALFEHNFLVPIMRAIDTDESSVTFDPRSNPATVRQAAQTSEKLQALKLVRQLVERAPRTVPRGVCMLLVTVAEDTKSNDTTFKRACLETLRDLMVRNTRQVALCNGLQTLIKAMLATDSDAFAESVAYALLFVLNDPATRCLLRPSLDVQMIFAPFTDSDGKVDGLRQQRLEASGRVIVTMMRSWTGLFFLCSDEFGLRTLVMTLLLPERQQIKQCIFETIVNILRIAAPNVSKRSMQGGSGDHGVVSGLVSPEASPFGQRNSTRARAVSSTSGSSSFVRTELAPRPPPCNLLDNYAAVLVLALVHAGLLEALQRLAEGFDVEMAARANELMSDLMDLSDQLFPRKLCLHLHRLPRLVSDACDFRPGADALARERACLVVTHLQKYGAGQWGKEGGGSDHEAAVSQLRWIREQVESRMGDEKWTSLLKESKVDTAGYKEFATWNWEKISDIVNGPLRNPARLQEVLDKNYSTNFGPSTNFVKSVLSVVLPSKRRLEEMRRNPETLYYIGVVCDLVSLLVASEEGRNHKTFIRLFKEIKDLLECEWKSSGEYASVLSVQNFNSRMVREYFTILGTMTASPTGFKILNDSFGSGGAGAISTRQLLQQLCTRGTRLDITQTIVSSLHYDMSQDSNTVLLLCLTEGHTNVRTCATQHLLHLCRAATHGFEEWGIDALVTQLNDKDDIIIRMALEILEEACDVDEYLSAAVLRNPTQQLVHLSKRAAVARGEVLKEDEEELQRISLVAHRILLRFAGHDTGVLFLQGLPRDSESGDRRGWIEAEIEEWDAHGNLRYVEEVEQALVRVLRSDRDSGDVEDVGGRGTIRHGDERRKTTRGVALKQVALPLHLYGELSKTPNGCEVLRTKTAQLQQWAMLLEEGLRLCDHRHLTRVLAPGTDSTGGNVGLAAMSGSNGLELRAALWVLGHIGSAQHGWALLQSSLECDVMSSVSTLATSSPFLSLRGTCLYVVGMLSSTEASRKRLTKLKWARSEVRSVAVPDSMSGIGQPRSGSRSNGEQGGVAQLFSVPSLPYRGAWAEQSTAAELHAPADTAHAHARLDAFVAAGYLREEERGHVRDLLGHAADMQNTVMLQEAKQGLLKVKAEMPHLYSSPAVLALLYTLMDGAPLALRVRKFLQQKLFGNTSVTGSEFGICIKAS